jgi:hypothetical protein
MTETFASLKIVGGLLPADVIGRIYAGDADVPGIGAQTYGLEPGESVRRQASRVWQYLLEKWQEFKARVDASPDAASARVTRERWLHILLRELGFAHLAADASVELGGKSYPVSHRFGPVPVHLLGWRTDLDHKTPQVTARPPQAMLQELLNRSDDYLWALLSNGSVLRLLRDSTILTGQAYAEFDLEAVFDGEIFSDFVCMYLLCHATRFSPAEGGGPASCYLEQWRAFAADQGQRALAQLRRGVEQAISHLGTGFLSHPGNQHLRARLDPRSGELRIEDFNRSLLRLIYRLLFWFVAEDRGVLLDPGPDDPDRETAQRLRLGRQRYETYFSSARLRKLARTRHGDRHGDLYEAIQVVFDALGSEGGVPHLTLPGIGGIFETELPQGRPLPLDEPLTGVRLSNKALLSAVRALAIVTPREGGARRPVDFGNLGAEELGSVYEGLLEQIPRYNDETRAYTLETLPGHERKETGSYYTPTSLVDCLLDSALDPLLDEACVKPTPAERIAALFDITVCDPACGSGHFLVAAARRIAKRIAAEETGESEPPEPEIRKALRRVVGRCIYGVDVNPMAAELAKVSLWLETLEPGKPLSYLDQNIRVGNSLLGVTPALLADGLPDAAFTPIEGDDRKVCTALKKQNAAERLGQHDLFSQSGIPVSNSKLAKRADSIAHTLPDSLEDLHIHQQRQAETLAGSSELRIQRLIADAWCAAFVQLKTEGTRSTAITHAVIENFAADNASLDLAAVEDLVAKLTRQYRFFHWHVEFPHIFRVGSGSPEGWTGGFSCILGNPPWERVKLEEQEFFSSRDKSIRDAPNAAARKKLVAALAGNNPKLYKEFQNELRQASGWSFFLHESGRYPLTGRGDVNTYAVFSEAARTLIGNHGRLGIIVPTGIATDKTTSSFFRKIVSSSSLSSLYDFQTGPGLWSRIGHARFKFSLLVIVGSAETITATDFAFSCRSVDDLKTPGKRFELMYDEIAVLNPDTGTCPAFQSRRDADISLRCSKRFPLMFSESTSSPSISQRATRFGELSDLNRAESLDYIRRSNPGGKWAKVYEAKLFHQFDHRFASYCREDSLEPVNHNAPYATTEPRIWIRQNITSSHYGQDWPNWVVAYRDIARSGDERTMISAVIPHAGADYTVRHLVSAWHRQPFILAVFNSFIYDYLIRLRNNGTHLSDYITYQIPLPQDSTWQDPQVWTHNSFGKWIIQRVLELTYTAWDMEPFARDLGDDGPPFQWDEERRFVMRAELDAAFFHLYGIERDDVDYIMETFPIVKRKDIGRHGSFRTKELILQIYDAMAEAERTGRPYETILDPPPGQGPRHPARAGVEG